MHCRFETPYPPLNVRENVTELKGKRKDGPPLTSDYITPWKGGRGG